jgi:catechol 2,3-dioxygenase-like lactoylglutathione lyase family enzyme
MDFASVRIITDNLDEVVGFYEQITGVSAVRPAPVFASLRLPSANVDFGHAQTAQLFKDAAHPADNRTVILDFIVDDVDKEYERLKTFVSDWVLEPTTMPWGNRSVLFRDPDGNLVNLFTPVTEEAIKRFNSKVQDAGSEGGDAGGEVSA